MDFVFQQSTFEGEPLEKRFFKRLLISYFGLTSGLWVISLSITSHGYDFENSLAWKIVSIPRNILTGIGVASFLLWQFSLWIEQYSLAEKRRQEHEQRKRCEEEVVRERIERQKEIINFEREMKTREGKEEEAEKQ